MIQIFRKMLVFKTIIKIYFFFEFVKKLTVICIMYITLFYESQEDKKCIDTTRT